MPAREATIHRSIVRYLESIGAVVVSRPFTRAGWPDIVAAMPGGVTWYIEVKQPGGRLSAKQVHTHDLLRATGAVVMVVESRAEVEQTYMTYRAMGIALPAEPVTYAARRARVRAT